MQLPFDVQIQELDAQLVSQMDGDNSLSDQLQIQAQIIRFQCLNIQSQCTSKIIELLFEYEDIDLEDSDEAESAEVDSADMARLKLNIKKELLDVQIIDLQAIRGYIKATPSMSDRLDIIEIAIERIGIVKTGVKVHENRYRGIRRQEVLLDSALEYALSVRTLGLGQATTPALIMGPHLKDANQVHTDCMRMIEATYADLEGATGEEEVREKRLLLKLMLRNLKAIEVVVTHTMVHDLDSFIEYKRVFEDYLAQVEQAGSNSGHDASQLALISQAIAYYKTIPLYGMDEGITLTAINPVTLFAVPSHEVEHDVAPAVSLDEVDGQLTAPAA